MENGHLVYETNTFTEILMGKSVQKYTAWLEDSLKFQDGFCFLYILRT